MRALDIEVVAKGRSLLRNSEADESESIDHAEEREEEHESVSEFVDHVLTEDAVSAESAEDLGMDREGYEEYGHMVELGDNGNGAASEKAEQKAKVAAPEKEEVEAEASVAVAEKEEVEAEASVAVAEKEEVEEKKEEEFINDPLVKFAEEKPETAVDAEPGSAEEAEERPSKMVTVPIELTEEEIRNEVPVKVILDIKVHSG